MLSLSNNFIKKIENIENLVNLKYLSLCKYII
jgi:Leucine-rich repeat (LRR) protein